MSTANKGYGPQLPLCRLYERVSKNGAHYLTGRLGGAKVAVLRSKDTTDDGVPIWNVVLSEAPQAKRSDAGERRYVRTEADSPDDYNQDPSQRPASRRTGLAVEGVDEEIPF